MEQWARWGTRQGFKPLARWGTGVGVEPLLE
jgi:hypothetical protein